MKNIFYTLFFIIIFMLGVREFDIEIFVSKNYDFVTSCLRSYPHIKLKNKLKNIYLRIIFGKK